MSNPKSSKDDSKRHTKSSKDDYKRKSTKENESVTDIERSPSPRETIEKSTHVNVMAATHMLQPAPLQPVRATEMEPDHFDKLFLAISSIANGQQELVNAMREAGRKRKAVDSSDDSVCDEETRVDKGKRVETAKKQRIDVNTEYSEGEYSSGDELVDQIDSILTEGSDIMKPSSSHSQNDDDIDVAIMAHDFNTDEDVGPEINTQLAAIFNNMLSKRLSEEKLKPKIELYPTPSNVPLLNPPKVNNVIWEKLSANSRSRDINIKRSQVRGTRGMVALAKLTEMLLTAKKSNGQLDLQAGIKLALDAFALIANSNYEVSLRRRESMKREMNPRYAQLAYSSTPVTTELFGDDITKAIKDINETAKVGNAVTGPKQYRNDKAGYRPVYKSSYNNVGYAGAHSYRRNNTRGSFQRNKYQNNRPRGGGHSKNGYGPNKKLKQ